MVACRIRIVTISVTLLFSGSLPAACAEVNSAQSLQSQSIHEIYSALRQLKGHEDLQDATLQYLVAEVAKVREIVDAIGPMSAQIKADEFGNQRAEFIEQLLDLHCALLRDNCDLRTRIAALELENRRRLHPGSISPAPAPPAFEPSPEPITPAPQIWPDHVAYITDRRDYFCRRAVCVATSAYTYDEYGNLCKGDIFRTCQGVQVMLIPPSAQSRYYVAVR